MLNAYPLISQKLTVFEERMPVKYSDTQSVAGFAVLIALKLGLSSAAVEVIFATAQMHDAGFLNVDPKAVFSFESLPEDQQRVFFKEQLAVGKQFLDQVPNLPKSVGDSVLAHQERSDGSGWPEGIIGDSNSIESQVVGLAVMLNDAYSRKLKPRGFDCSHLIPVIEVQSESFDIDVYHAAVEMLREGAHKTSQVIPAEFMSPLANYLVVLQRTLIHWFDLAKVFSNNMDEVLNLKGGEPALSQISSLEQLFRNSGVWQKGIRTWLLEIAPSMNPDECTQVELLALLFESILQKFKRLQWSMHVSAKRAGPEWMSRCDELAVLLYSMPSDHFDAFEKFDCF